MGQGASTWGHWRINREAISGLALSNHNRYFQSLELITVHAVFYEYTALGSFYCKSCFAAVLNSVGIY